MISPDRHGYRVPVPSTETLTTSMYFDGHIMHGPTSLTIEDGVVVDLSAFGGTPVHHLLSPGLVDLQVNGFDDVDCADADPSALARLDETLATAGTTSWLATLVTDGLDVMARRTDVLASAPPGCIGVHLEGPFLGSAPGAHRTSRIMEPDIAWLSDLPPHVRLVTLGAESHLAPAAVRLLRDKGVVVSIGHTKPTRDQWEAAVGAGAQMVTHLFNAMSGIHHRDFGLALAALTDERVVFGLIADTHHVQPDAVALAFASRPDGVCLVSDSVAWRSPWALNAGVSVRDGVPVLANGTLAGSSTPLAECVRRAVTRCGAGLPDALRAATSTPANMIDRTDIGTISAGVACDIVAWDTSLRVVRTLRRLQSPRGFQTDI